MHPWSKDCGCPFARVGPISIRSPRGPPAPFPGDGLRGLATGPGLSVSQRSRSLSPGNDETWPQPRVPRGGPEPSRAQLLQGRAASDEPLKSSLESGASFSQIPSDTVPPCSSLVLWCAKQAGSSKNPLARDAPRVDRRHVPLSLTGRGYRSRGGPEWRQAPVRGSGQGLVRTRFRSGGPFARGGRRTEVSKA